MLSYKFCALGVILSAIIHGIAAEAADTLTGPLSFFWPIQRRWDAIYQNDGPCGTNASVKTRTEFPLDSGKISLNVADDITGLAVRIAYVEDPISQSNFTSELLLIPSIAAGQMCYSVPHHLTVPSGTDATIQLEYSSVYSGEARSQAFYACADVTLVGNSNVSATFSCLNTTTSGTSSDDETSSSPSKKSGGGLSTGTKIGTAIGSTVGGAAIIAVLVFLVLHRRRARIVTDTELNRIVSTKQMDDAGSVVSA